jgi:predicted ATP-grasp superfamily ATP-dependent carboligase
VKPALVASGYTMALAAVRGLGAAGVPVIAVHYAETDMAHRSRYVSHRIRTPRPMYDERGFVETLLERGRRFEGGLLIPASDAALVAVSRHRETLAERFVVAAPPWDVTEAFIDKARTAQVAGAAGVPAPITVIPADLAGAEEAAARVGYPCLVKPTVGHAYRATFGRKMTRVVDAAGLRAAYEPAAAAGLTVMIQELIPGPDRAGANYNAYAVEGRPVVEFTAAKVRSAPRGLGSPCVVRSERIDEIVEPGRAIVSALSLAGFACVEFKRDPRDGVWKLMEVNGRTNLSGMLAIACGINFPLIEYRHLIEGETPRPQGFREGVTWIDLLRDVRQVAATIAEDGARGFVRPYSGPRVFAVGSWRDPLPLAVQVVKGTRSAAGRLAGCVQRPAREPAASRSTDAT